MWRLSEFLSEVAIGTGAEELELPLKGLRPLQEDQAQKLLTVPASVQ